MVLLPPEGDLQDFHTDIASNVPVKLKLQHPPPGIPRAFDCPLCPGRGEFERCFARAGNLNRIYLLFWRNVPLRFFGFLQGLTD